MTSTPVSLNDESLNGSWIDINSASQIHSPEDGDSPKYQRPPHSLAESVQSLGLMSFQVERFLQESQKLDSGNNNNNNNPSPAIRNAVDGSDNNPPQQNIVDNISDLYLSDSDVSIDGLSESRILLNNLRKHHQRQLLREREQRGAANASNIRIKYDARNYDDGDTTQCIDGFRDILGQKLSKSGECLVDQLSDSLSLFSRASMFGETNFEQAASFQDYDWLWDWTAQPEYFAGQEWKAAPPKRAQRRVYCTDANESNYSFGEIVSLLFLTNILSIIIGAGLTYSIIKRKVTL